MSRWWAPARRSSRCAASAARSSCAASSARSPRRRPGKAADRLVDLLERFGALIVFLNTLIHEAGLPAPLTPTVLVAGAAMSDVVKQTAQLTAAIVVGSVLGNAIWFALGRKYGSRVLARLCKLSLSPQSCVTKTGAAFGRWGSALLIVGRFVPGISLVALQGAGVEATLLVIAVLGIYLGWRYVRRQQAMRMKGVPRIDPGALNAELANATAPIVIDVRADDPHRIGAPRIPGARFHSLKALRNLPLEQLAGRPVVLYCACPEEASAAMGALILQGREYLDARALKGGIEAWIAAGYETQLGGRAPHVARELEHEL